MAWNMMVDYDNKRINEIIRLAPQWQYKEYIKARSAPSIIHYAGPQKPWFFPEMDFGDEFWRYAKKTPWYEIMLYRMINNSSQILYQKEHPKEAKYKKIFDGNNCLFPYGSKRREDVYKRQNLPYRTLDFVFETYDQEYYQEICTVNYPNNYDFTRITEFKHMTGQIHSKTTIVKEYPQQYDSENKQMEPYYPIPQKENEILYSNYLNLSKQFPDLILSGRLADYKYYTMSETIEKALSVFEKELKPNI